MPTVTCSVRISSPQVTVDRTLVSLVEWERSLTYRHEDDRQRFLAGRSLAKQLISEMSGIEPRQVQILTRCQRCGSTAHGKPYAQAADRNWPVSIAHAGERVAVVASQDVDVGIDVEQVREEAIDAGVIRLVASGEERSIAADAEGFTRLWVCKEAVLKCTGEGLMTSPTTLTLSFDGEHPVLVRSELELSLREVRVSGAYRCAVAVATTGALELDVIALELER